MSENDGKLTIRATRIGFLLLDGFAMMSYAAVAEPFRAANVLSGRQLYRWVHIGRPGADAQASSGARIGCDLAVGAIPDIDILFVFAAGDPAGIEDAALFAWLRMLAARGVRVGGVSGGPYVLAKAGLLDGYRCTIHWEHRPAFVEAFPQLRVLTGLYVIDGDRLTCAGGTAGLDLAIALIAQDHGAALGDAVGEWYIRTQLRDSGAAQRLSLRERYGTTSEAVLQALALMEASVEEPLDRATLARRTGVSVRQLERLFARALGTGMAAQYRRIRLDRAVSLLRETGLSVTQIAMACGFVSPSHFSRSFKAAFGFSPEHFRRRR